MSSRLRRWTRRAAVTAVSVGAAAVVFDLINDRVVSRSARTVVNALRVGYLYKTIDPETAEELSELHATAGQIILDTCLANEGLYIKMGQGLSAVNHILPQEYTDRLKVLLDRAPAVPIDDVARIFREETGRDFLDVFVSFDPAPVASASIAQVHKAAMKLDDGSVVDVAVKVQKPKIRKQIWWDLQCYFFVCRMLQWAFDLPLMWSARCIAENLTQEIDFTHEASNTHAAKQNFAASGRHDVYVPHIYEQLLTKRLLVLEWISATKLVDIELVSKHFSAKDVMQTVLESFGEMIFQHGLVHCDPHPANLMVRKNTNPLNKKPFEVVVLDFGLCVPEAPKFRLEYALLFKSIFTADRETLKHIVESWGIGNADLFASLTLQKPFTAKPVHSAAVSKDDVKAMEKLMKANVRYLLQNEALVPQELVFVGRSMNLLRALNKSYGAPVNRVNILASCAVRGLGHIRCLDDITHALGMHVSSSAGASALQSSRKRRHVLRLWWVEWQFRMVLAWISFAHAFTQYYNALLACLLPHGWSTALRVGNLEEVLEKKEQEVVQSAKRMKFHEPMRIGSND